jgi:hypothetical protein
MYDTIPIAGSPQEREMPGDTHREDEKRGRKPQKTAYLITKISESWIYGLSFPHKHGVIAYAGNLVALAIVPTLFNIHTFLSKEENDFLGKNSIRLIGILSSVFLHPNLCLIVKIVLDHTRSSWTLTTSSCMRELACRVVL